MIKGSLDSDIMGQFNAWPLFSKFLIMHTSYFNGQKDIFNWNFNPCLTIIQNGFVSRAVPITHRADRFPGLQMTAGCVQHISPLFARCTCENNGGCLLPQAGSLENKA